MIRSITYYLLNLNVKIIALFWVLCLNVHYIYRTNYIVCTTCLLNVPKPSKLKVGRVRNSGTNVILVWRNSVKLCQRVCAFVQSQKSGLIVFSLLLHKAHKYVHFYFIFNKENAGSTPIIILYCKFRREVSNVDWNIVCTCTFFM